ncbi:hypothetical protein SFC57_11250 [Niallia circulans]|nr:hypothetical protein [Niallia circulans]
MTAALFAVTNLQDGDASAFFGKKAQRLKKLPLPSLGLATVGLIYSIITALLLLGKYMDILRLLLEFCRCIIGHLSLFRR